MKEKLRIDQKYLLRITEAAEYYGIGTKRMRGIAEGGKNIFSVMLSNERWMIHQEKFNEYIDKTYFSGKEPDEDIPAKVF